VIAAYQWKSWDSEHKPYDELVEVPITNAVVSNSEIGMIALTPVGISGNKIFENANENA